MEEIKNSNLELLTTDNQPFWKRHFKLIIGVLISVFIIIILVVIFSNGEKKNPSYEFGLSIDELKKRTSEKYLGKKILLKSDSEEYNSLE